MVMLARPALRDAVLRSPYQRSLLQNLQAVWTLEDAAGSPTDKSGNGNTLTNNNAVTLVAGPSGKMPKAAAFARASSQSYSGADGASIRNNGAGSFTVAVLGVNLASMPAANSYMGICIKKAAGDFDWELACANDATSNRFYFNAIPATATRDDGLGIPSTGVWYALRGWYDSVAGTVNIQSNQNGITSAAAAAPATGTGALRLGTSASDATAHFLDGSLAMVAMWWRTLTAGEWAWLYNGGAGRSFSASRGFY